MQGSSPLVVFFFLSYFGKTIFIFVQPLLEMHLLELHQFHANHQIGPIKNLSWCNNSIHVNSTHQFKGGNDVPHMIPWTTKKPSSNTAASFLIHTKWFTNMGGPTPSNWASGIVKLLGSCCQIRINHKGLLLDITQPYFQTQLFHLLDKWHCSLSNSLIPTCL